MGFRTGPLLEYYGTSIPLPAPQTQAAAVST